MRNLWYIWAVLLFVGCAEAPVEERETESEVTVEEEGQSEEKKSFEMYELSEMSAIMQHMYQLNEQLKERIETGGELGSYSESFERMLNAKMTNDKPMDDFFKTHAETFLANQRSIYESPDQAKELYNEAINSCIACHEVKCTGPITKIEKLFIK
jgi:cytochrome c556